MGYGKLRAQQIFKPVFAFSSGPKHGQSYPWCISATTLYGQELCVPKLNEHTGNPIMQIVSDKVQSEANVNV